MSVMERSSIKATGRVIGRSVVAISLAGALMIVPGISVNPMQAFAATGSVTITGDTGDTYKVYQIFTADIDADNNATNIAWNDSLKSAVQTFLNSNDYANWLTAKGYTASGAADNPQYAAEFIAEKIDAGPWDTSRIPAAGSFAAELAQALASQAVTGSATTSTPYTADQGYYLFVSNAIADATAGTAAIWVPINSVTGGQTIAEKTAVPTVQKQVKEDSGSTFGEAADGNQAQELDYLLTGTLPSNFGAFESYHYKFEDTLPSGKMDMQNSNTSSVVVKVGEVDVTTQLTGQVGSISYTGGVLTVDIANLKSLTGVTVTKDSVITVAYKAHLTTGSVIGSAGNTNEVELTYTADPVSLQDKGGLKDTAKAYTYQLDIVKVDKQAGTVLAGAGFTIQVASGNSDAASVGKYVATDGSLVDYNGGINDAAALTAAGILFTTDVNGKFSVPRIDEGTYTVHEAVAPAHYKPQTSDMQVVISSDLNQTSGACTSLTATVSGGEAGQTPSIATHLATASDATPYGVTAPNVETGIIGAVTSDPKDVPMPVTGMDGVTTAVLGGTIAIALGGLALFMTRKRRDESEASEV